MPQPIDDISAGQFIGVQPNNSRNRPDPEMLRRMAVKYLNIDPAHPEKGRIGIKGGGMLTPDEEHFARERYGSRFDRTDMAKQPHTQIKYKMGDGPEQVYEGRVKPLATFDYSQLQKDRDLQTEAKATIEKDKAYSRAKQERESSPEYQMGLLSVQAAKDKMARDASLQERGDEERRDERRINYGTRQRAEDAAYAKKTNAYKIAQDGSEFGNQVGSAINRGIDPELALSNAQQKTDAMDESQQATLLSLLPKIAERNPAMVPALLSKIKGLQGIDSNLLATGLVEPKTSDKVFAKGTPLEMGLRKLVTLANGAGGSFDAGGTQLAKMKKQLIQEAVNKGMQEDEAATYIESVLEDSVNTPGYMSNPISAIADTFLPGTPLEDSVTSRGAVRKGLGLTPRGLE